MTGLPVGGVVRTAGSRLVIRVGTIVPGLFGREQG
jgi:hypothetical protein